MVVVFWIIWIASEQWFVGKWPKHIQIEMSKYAQKHSQCRKNTQKTSILIAIFQRSVIKASTTEMRGPDTSADASVWPV